MQEQPELSSLKSKEKKKQNAVDIPVWSCSHLITNGLLKDFGRFLTLSNLSCSETLKEKNGNKYLQAPSTRQRNEFQS